MVIEEDGKTEDEFVEENLNIDDELNTLNRTATTLEAIISANIKHLTTD